MLGTIFGLLGGILGPIVTYAGKKIVDLLLSRDQAATDLKNLRDKREAVRIAALRAVRQVEIEFVKPLKDKGEWSETHRNEAQVLALKYLNLAYGDKGLLDLTMFFNTNLDGLQAIFAQVIDSAVIENRQKPGQKLGSIKLVNDVVQADLSKIKSLK